MFTRFIPKKCVFPAAVKPWQKAMCIAMGVTTFAGGAYVIYRITPHAYNIYKYKIYESLPEVKDPFDGKLKIPFDKLLNMVCPVIGTVSGALETNLFCETK